MSEDDDDEEDNGLKIYEYSSSKEIKYKGNPMVKKLLKNTWYDWLYSETLFILICICIVDNFIWDQWFMRY